jgi:DNA-binding NarL/FixJ family response regulator
MESGAAGFLLKDSPALELAAAIRSAAGSEPGADGDPEGEMRLRGFEPPRP